MAPSDGNYIDSYRHLLVNSVNISYLHTRYMQRVHILTIMLHLDLK